MNKLIITFFSIFLFIHPIFGSHSNNLYCLRQELRDHSLNIKLLLFYIHFCPEDRDKYLLLLADEIEIIYQLAENVDRWNLN